MIQLEAGSLLGRYKILRRLGAGAMGEVFLAEDPQIGRQLALKTVRVEEGKPQEVEERKRRLLREARAAGKLLHPNIVTLFDAGEDQGMLYLAFEYVEGKDLADRISEGPALSIAEALAIVRQAAEALDYAHRQGVVHRDIKPSNLMITADGRVKVADFGIAKLLDQTSDLTMTGSVVGSPHYLSPEQIRGEELDGRTDIFSLGVLLYEVLCQKRPFEADTLTTLVYQILNQEPTPIVVRRPELGPRLERLVRRMLHKDRDQRFATAAELAAEVAACERELAPSLLATRARPDEPTDATVRLPEEVATAVQGGRVPPLPQSGTAAAPPTSVPGVAPPAAPGKGKLGIVLAAIAVVVLGLVAVGIGARRFVARHARTAVAQLERQNERAAGSTPAAPVAESSSADDQGGPKVEPSSTGASAVAEDRTSTDAAAQELPFQPGEHPVLKRSPAASSQPAATERTLPTSSPSERAAPEVTPGAAEQPAPSSAPESGAVAAPPTVPNPAPAAEAPAASRPVRDAIVEHISVNREMSTGMNLSFDVKPKKAAERVVVRFDRIVIGRAYDWDASRRGGRSYSVPEPGLHILTFLVDGVEVYRIRIDAQPGNVGPTPVHLALPQFGRRPHRFGRF